MGADNQDKTPPGVAPEKWARLLVFLGGLPVAAASKLFAVLETDRARGGKGLPHDALINHLRAALFEAKGEFPARTPTAQRLFFTPVEDFIVAARRGRKRRARIARSSLAPIWTLVMNDPACAPAAKAAADLDAALGAGNKDAVDALTLTMYARACEDLSKILTHADEDKSYRADLGDRLAPAFAEDDKTKSRAGAGALHDLAEINFLLPAVEQFRKLQSAFPKPVAALTEEDLFDIRQLYAAAHKEEPEAAPYLLLCLAGRMESPWRALGVYYHLAGAEDDALPDASDDASVIVETLFDDLEGMARMLERDAEGDFDGEDARLRLGYFSDYAKGLLTEARRAGDGVVANRVEACRDIVAAALERFTEQALAALRKGTPVRHAGGSSQLAGLRPDCEREIAPATARAASEAAVFLADAAHSASRLERPADLARAHDEAVAHLRRYAGDLVLEIRAAEGHDRKAARALMDQVLHLAGSLLPADEIALLREKAAAAAVTA